MEVQIIIKAPNQNVEDHVVPCNLDWSVENVKEHLSKAYPNKPRPSQKKGNSSRRHPPAVNDPASGQSTPNTVRQRNVASVPHANAFYPQFPQNLAPQVAMPVFIPDSQVAAQMAAMQQMYAYYFSQYIQSMNPATNNPPNNVFPGTPVYQQPANQATPPLNQNQPNQNQRLPPPNQNPPQEPDNDEVHHRDWLDHLFLCCRFLMLFSLIYFYSTPERLMIVIIFAVFAFLYQEGWFVRRIFAFVPEEAPQEIPNVPDPPDLQNSDGEPLLVNQDLGANDDGLGEYELEATMDGEDPPHAQQPTDDANNNHIFSPLTFLSTFFSSLIPDPPPPININ